MTRDLYNEAQEEVWAGTRETYPMWGTEAHAKLGDISRDEGDFFSVLYEDEDNYYGSWYTGFGFFDVRFPKATSRPITAEEQEFLDTHPVVIV